MNPSNATLSNEQESNPLLPVYLGSIRQRFKNEINRLTSGDMLEILQEQPDAADMAFVMTYLYAWHWLQHNVEKNFQHKVLETFSGPRFGFLMKLLLSDSAESFLTGYIQHWQNFSGEAPLQKMEFLRLLQGRDNDTNRLIAELLDTWNSLGLFRKSHKIAYQELARHERNRYAEMLDEHDLARLELVDMLAEKHGVSIKKRFDKLGLIPAMGCPQTCRHCMFIWRPPKPVNNDRQGLFSCVDSLTDSVLFTGGDLTRQLDSFYEAIRSMPSIKTFAILLNGDFAEDVKTTRDVVGKMAAAIRERRADWAQARVLLQISFDEFHQEVYVDKKGRLRERIPVAKIANIVEVVPEFQNYIQLALLHKQTSLNFSMDVIHKGVFARLVSELGSRGHKVEVLSASPSPRMKRNPLKPDDLQPVLKDASFILKKYPSAPIMLTSSTIDGYGRAETLDETEIVKEKDLLQQVVEGRKPHGETFDTDLMFWFNGWVTLFNAVHICMGDFYTDSLEKILRRQAADPLCQALNEFDTRLIDIYKEKKPDYNEVYRKATGPHHLFHMLTEDSEMRLYMTRRLAGTI